MYFLAIGSLEALSELWAFPPGDIHSKHIQFSSSFTSVVYSCFLGPYWVHVGPVGPVGQGPGLGLGLDLEAIVANWKWGRRAAEPPARGCRSRDDDGDDDDDAKAKLKARVGNRHSQITVDHFMASVNEADAAKSQSAFLRKPSNRQ